MRTLSTTMIWAQGPFAPLFSKRVWEHAQLLLAGEILAPGRRTVGSALRTVGLDREKRFHRYHPVLSRASLSIREPARVLLGLLVKTFVCEGPLVLGVDETLNAKKPTIKPQWTDTSNNETNLMVERSTDATSPSPTWTALTQAVAANTTSYTDNNGLLGKTRYFYRVTAKNAVGNSASSNTASVTTR
jgi:hypothetical protein